MSVSNCESLTRFVLCLLRLLSTYLKYFPNIVSVVCEILVNEKVLLAGNFNVDFSARNLLITFGWNMHGEIPTRLTGSCETIIDYMCSNLYHCSILGFIRS